MINADGALFIYFQCLLIHCLASGSNVSGLIIDGMDTNTLCNLLLFGSNDLDVVQNRIIIEATISFIVATKRLD